MSDVEKLILDQLNKIEGSINVLRAENQEEFRRVYDKIGALEEKTEAVHIQTTKTNGRVTRLEESHKICPVADIEKRVQNIESRETEEYKTGKFLKTAAIVCGWIVGISLVGSGVLGIVVYIKDTL